MRYSALILFLVTLVLGASAQQNPTGVYVNGVELGPDTLAQLERAYRTEVPRGRYWYDRRSGLWGLIGGPGTGQIAPNLELGGPLQMDASRAQTGVFVNGREIHPTELAYLQRLYGRVVPARYWLDANGIAGYEGGPAQFNLGAAAGAGAAGGYNRNTPGGGLMSDGRCAGYLHPDGATVMSGDC